jgi:hypothetical protein
MRKFRAVLVATSLVSVPTMAWAQTTTTIEPSTTTTTTAVVTRVDNLVCAEPVNQVATCVDSQGRTVTRVDDPQPRGTGNDGLVCSEPVNQVARCVDSQGRLVTRVDDPTTTAPRTVGEQPRVAEPAQAGPPRQLALTG